MANRTNNKSQMTTVRIPHEVMEGIESLKQDGESTAGFLVAAARGEIARRQIKQNGGDALANLNSALDTLANIEAISAKAGKDLQEITAAARQQLQQLHPSSEPPVEAPAPKPKGKTRMLGG